MSTGLYLTRGFHLVLYEQSSVDVVVEIRDDGALVDFSGWTALYGGLAAQDGGPTLAELVVTKSVYDREGVVLETPGDGFLRVELHRLLIEDLVDVDLGLEGRGSVDLFGDDTVGVRRAIIRGTWELVRASAQETVFA